MQRFAEPANACIIYQYVEPAECAINTSAGIFELVQNGDIAGNHFGLAAGIIFDSLRIAALERRDEWHVHAADETDLTGLIGLRGDHANEKRALFGLEIHGLHVRLVDERVDDGELGVGELVGDLAEGGRPGESGHDDRAEAVLGELAEDLLALRLVLDLEIPEFDSGLVAKLGRAVEHAFVERLVELAAKVINDGWLDVCGGGRGGGDNASGKNR